MGKEWERIGESQRRIEGSYVYSREIGRAHYLIREKVRGD